ncbi:hypothetical protein SAMD00019534_072400, partial [Acytostelium subglobosum LB1]|uniref:hypothetical protein n=1 Tax=Acytostelium subglobosum LB1 TaxID=1410327 RepID=UPI0006449545
TSHLWGANSTSYHSTMKAVGFTAAYCTDALDLTIGENLTKPYKLLDVACGYGALTIQAAQRVSKSGGSIVGVDFAPGMLEQLKRESQGLTNLTGECMNGEDLKIDDNTFDYCYSAFGLIIFEDRVKGLSELHRVVKPNGEIAITTWPYDCELFTLMKRSFRRVVDYDIPDEAFQRITLGDGEFLREQFKKAGFTKPLKVITKIHNMDLPVNDMMNFFVGHPLIMMLSTYLPEDKHDQFHPAIRQELNQMYPDGHMCLPVRCAIAIGE